VAQLIGNNLGTRIFWVTLGGFDDHAREIYAHAATLRALVAITADSLPPYDPKWEDLYFVIETRVADASGGRGEFRLALSRNDAWAALARLALRDQTLEILAAIDGIREAVLDQAERHRDTLIMAHTHHQHAQPTTAAHYLLAVAATLGRCADRYRDALVRLNRSPLGAGALTTTGFPIDRAYTAELLGFSGLVENSYDAVAAADHVGELQAWNVDTGKKVWTTNLPSFNWGPVLATGGDLLFAGGTNDRMFRAFDAKTGNLIRQFVPVPLEGPATRPAAATEPTASAERHG